MAAKIFGQKLLCTTETLVLLQTHIHAVLSFTDTNKNRSLLSSLSLTLQQNIPSNTVLFECENERSYYIEIKTALVPWNEKTNEEILTHVTLRM
jgi:hypothetical protein